jgi:hypothetical protein
LGPTHQLIVEVGKEIWRFVIIAVIILYTFAVAFATVVVNKGTQFDNIVHSTA